MYKTIKDKGMKFQKAHLTLNHKTIKPTCIIHFISKTTNSAATNNQTKTIPTPQIKTGVEDFT